MTAREAQRRFTADITNDSTIVSITEPIIEMFHPKKYFITIKMPTKMARLLNACFSTDSSHLALHERMLAPWMHPTYPCKDLNATH